MFSSNSGVHDGVGWVWFGKVETAIMPFVVAVATESTPCPTPSLGHRSRRELMFGVLVRCFLWLLCNLEFGLITHHGVKDDCKTSS